MKVVTVGTSSIVSSCIKSFKNAGIEVFACVGRDLERVKSFAENNGVQYYSNDYDRVLTSNAYDFVYIATPNNKHYEYARKAILAKKNVILEKPMCSNLKQATEIIKLALDNGVFLFENNKVPYNRAYTYLKEDLKKIEPVRMVDLNFSKYSSKYDDFKAGKPQNTFSLETSGGALMDINVYNISFVLGLFGMPKKCAYYCNKSDGIDISGTAILQYDGFISSNIACKDCNSMNYVNIVGENGYICYNGHSSVFDSYDLNLNGQESEHKDFHNDDKFYDTFTSYREMYENKDYAKCEEYLKLSLMVMKVLDDLRKSAGIVYTDDNN